MKSNFADKGENGCIDHMLFAFPGYVVYVNPTAKQCIYTHVPMAEIIQVPKSLLSMRISQELTGNVLFLAFYHLIFLLRYLGIFGSTAQEHNAP